MLAVAFAASCFVVMADSCFGPYHERGAVAVHAEGSGSPALLRPTPCGGAATRLTPKSRITSASFHSRAMLAASPQRVTDSITALRGSSELTSERERTLPPCDR